MLPSVDRAGRYFPLTFAALNDATAVTAEGNAWLDRCEAVGRGALEQDTPPEEISDMVGRPELPLRTERVADAVWWSEGSPRVTTTRMTLSSMPDAAIYAEMLGAGEATS
jgi:hypothetical protein